MQRIPLASPETARGFRRLAFALGTRRLGGAVPGIMRVLLYDLNVGIPASRLYNYLNLRKSSPLTRLQREMLATVVNGKVGGAP